MRTNTCTYIYAYILYIIYIYVIICTVINEEQYKNQIWNTIPKSIYRLLHYNNYIFRFIFPRYLIFLSSPPTLKFRNNIKLYNN